MPEEVTAGADRPRLSTLFQRLDSILSQLDREDIDLEEQMALYREACGHLSSARAILDDTQAEIEFLMGSDAAPAVEPD